MLIINNSEFVLFLNSKNDKIASFSGLLTCSNTIILTLYDYHVVRKILNNIFEDYALRIDIGIEWCPLDFSTRHPYNVLSPCVVSLLTIRCITK